MPTNPADFYKVYGTITKHGSLTLYELMSLTAVPDAEVSEVIDYLKAQNLVRVRDTGTPDSVITVREKVLENPLEALEKLEKVA
jgi:transcription initiation factor IIE alpha subunit